MRQAESPTNPTLRRAPRFFLASLDSPRFRWLLLLVIVAGVIPAFTVMILLLPFVRQSVPGDLAVYLQAAGQIHTGVDPYTTWLASHAADTTRRQGYIYPPFLAWALTPLINVPPMLVVAGVFVVDLAALAAFWLLTARGLGLRGLQPLVLMVVATLGFFPVQENFKWGQVNLLILALCSFWSLAWVEGFDEAGGLSLGVAIAIKLLQAPVLLLPALATRLRMLVASIAVVVVAFLVAAPSLLSEYVTRVLPELDRSTGYIANLAPIGFIARLVNPAAVFADVGDVPVPARIAATLISLFATAITAAVILRSRGGPGPSPSTRWLQAACALSLAPLISTIDWPAHMALELIPMAIVLEWSIRTRRPRFALTVAACWLLLGPAQQVLWAVANDPGPLRANAEVVFWLLAQGSSIAPFLLCGAAAVALELEVRTVRGPGVELALDATAGRA